MKAGKFWLGMAMGAAAGVGLEMAVQAKKDQMKTTAARTMQSMGTAMDNAAEAIDPHSGHSQK